MQSENNFLKEDLVVIANRSRNNSCTNDKIRVSGEYYVTKNKSKKKQVDILKIKTLFLASATIALLAVGIKVSGDIDFTDEIRNEAVKTQTVFNPIGGKYKEEYIYGEDFVDYINELSDYELKQLYDQTVDTMYDNGLDKEASIQSEVVSNMHNVYESSLNKGSK